MLLNAQSSLRLCSAFLWHASNSICHEPVIFLVGGPRCGTTLLKQVLGSFPEICSVEQESTCLFLLRPRSWHRRYLSAEPGGLDERQWETPDDPVAVFSRIAAGRRQATDSAFFLDKLNTVFLHRPGFYVRHFPNAKFLVISRDARDAVASAATHVYLKTHSIERMAVIWNRFFTFAQQLQQIQPAYSVSYEQLTRNPEETVASIAGFLGVPFDAEILRPDRYRPDTRMSSTEGFWRLRDPISPVSVGRYKDRLSKSQIELVESTCATGMRQLGYV
ncbi:MAG: sulfotransferase [Opitutales bacterium]